VIHHFHRLIAWPRGQPTSSCQQMRALPDSASLQTLILVIPVTHGDESNQGRAEHQL
jgi:hypothetical protein